METKTEDLLRYNALDSACMMQIYEAIWEDVSRDYSHTYDLTIDLLPVLLFMQTRGVRVDQVKLGETKRFIKTKIAEKQAELDAICERPLDVNSSKDCSAYFYKEMGAKPYLGKAGNPTVDDKALQRLIRPTSTRKGFPAAKVIQEIRGMGKLYNTYLNMDFDADNRMRACYNPRGTKFGRLSSGKTVFGTGMNFQNLPQEFKRFLVPDPGYILLELDKRQAEWVVVAYTSNDSSMIKAIEEGVDVHVHTASLMYNVDAAIIRDDENTIGHSTDTKSIRELREATPRLAPYIDKFPRTMSARQAGKRSNHGLNYDESYQGFALLNEIPEAEGKMMVDSYHRIYPGIRDWHRRIREQLNRDRTLTNCFGRKVFFMEQWNSSLFRSAYAMQPQSTVADSLNQGMIRIYDDKWITKDLNLDILGQVHDSVVMQVPIESIKDKEVYDELWSRLDSYTSPELEYNGRKFKIASDLKASVDNWGGHHPKNNTFGMVTAGNYTDISNIISRAGV